MLLTRKKAINQLKIYSVELQTDICQLAQASIEINNLTSQIEIINQNLIGVNKLIGQSKFQIVTVNPPFFKYDSTSNINLNDRISTARHEIEVKLEDIIIESKKLLDNQGLFVCVFRPQRLDELIILLNQYQFTVKRIQFVYPKLGKAANTILVEAKKGTSNNQMIVEEPLIVYKENGQYTKQMENIFQI